MIDFRITFASWIQFSPKVTKFGCICNFQITAKVQQKKINLHGISSNFCPFLWFIGNEFYCYKFCVRMMVPVDDGYHSCGGGILLLLRLLLWFEFWQIYDMAIYKSVSSKYFSAIILSPMRNGNKQTSWKL